MNSKNFDKKLLKRCEFLRKLLEQYGIKWKLKLESKDKNMSVISFFPTFNGTYLHHNIDTISFSLYNDERFYTENEQDLILGISNATLDRFYNYGKTSATLKEFTKVEQILKNIIVYNPSDPSKFFISAIDFEGTIQNMILNGIPLDKFPSIEEVL